MPLADPDARVLLNKEGGYAPNYTGVLAVDSGHGIILDTQILGGNARALDRAAGSGEHSGKLRSKARADRGRFGLQQRAESDGAGRTADRAVDASQAGVRRPSGLAPGGFATGARERSRGVADEPAEQNPGQINVPVR